MADDYRIERMTAEEVDTAIEWAAKEGWNPGLHDATCFYQADPNGFFAGKRNGQIIAIGSAVIYDEHYAFCGFYIVAPEFRDQGYGLQLTQARLHYVGNRNAGIDGVMNMLDKYAQIGYRFAHPNARYEGKGKPLDPHALAQCVPLSQISWSTLLVYDRKHFPAPREAFLKCWVNQPNSLALAFEEQGVLKGYGVIRACREGFKIAPLFADTPAIAEHLFSELSAFADGQAVYLDIPENNTHAKQLVERHGLKKVFETARMYLNDQPDIEQAHIYGITSFELG